MGGSNVRSYRHWKRNERFITFHDSNFAYYVLWLYCNDSCKITGFTIGSKFAFINAPFGEDEKSIIESLKTKDHTRLYEYLSDTVQAPNYYCRFDLGELGFSKYRDGKDYLRKSGLLYDLFFDSVALRNSNNKIQYSFSDRFSTAFKFNLREYPSKNNIIKKKLHALNKTEKDNVLDSYILNLDCPKGEKCKIVWVDCKTYTDYD